jgi:hypothetical protein
MSRCDAVFQVPLADGVGVREGVAVGVGALPPGDVATVWPS